jgi:hypothetical protein
VLLVDSTRPFISEHSSPALNERFFDPKLPLGLDFGDPILSTDPLSTESIAPPPRTGARTRCAVRWVDDAYATCCDLRQRLRVTY